MIRLKLNLKEATVNYNEHGALVGFPVEHTPNQIRNYSIPLEITGYVSKNDFLAYSLSSTARKFTVGEQISLLTSLGFKTVPYFENENGNGNQLITIKNQYSMYGATWISLPSGKEFKVPELAHVNAVDWKISPAKTLTLVVTTDKGVFEVYDMKLLAYYQPGCTAKVWNGEIQPLNTAPVTVPLPTVCPKCNNPLKRIQIYPDLPVLYKCTNSLCDRLVLDEDQNKPVEPEVDTADEQDGFRDEVTSENSEQPILEDTIPSEDVAEVTDDRTAETAENVVTVDTESTAAVKQCVKCYVDVAKVEESEVSELVNAGKIEVVDTVDDAECILVKTKLAVSKTARALSKEHNLELKPVTDFE